MLWPCSVWLSFRANARNLFCFAVVSGCGRSFRRFPHHRFGEFILAKSFERWMPQEPVARPAGEGDLADELWLHPVNSSGIGTSRRVHKSRFADREPIELRA